MGAVELHKAYTEFGGDSLTHRLIVPNLCERFGYELVVLKSPGLADIVSLRCIAATCMRLVTDEDDDIDVTIKKLCKVIRHEVKLITLDKDCYDTTVNRQKCRETVSDTLMKLLGKLSPNLDGALPALLIGSMVTGVMKNHPTSLKITLGIKMRRSKNLSKCYKSMVLHVPTMKYGVLNIQLPKPQPWNLHYQAYQIQIQVQAWFRLL